MRAASGSALPDEPSTAARGARSGARRNPPKPPQSQQNNGGAVTFPRAGKSGGGINSAFGSSIKQWNNQDARNASPQAGRRPTRPSQNNSSPTKPTSKARAQTPNPRDSGSKGLSAGRAGRPGSAVPGGGENTKLNRQRRTLSAPAAGHRRATSGGTVSKKAAEAKKGGGTGGGAFGASSGPSSGANAVVGANGTAAVGTRAALQELLSDGGRRALPLSDPTCAPPAYRASSHLAAMKDAARLAESDPFAPLLTLPWDGPQSARADFAGRPPRAPLSDRGGDAAGGGGPRSSRNNSRQASPRNSRQASPRNSKNASPRVSPREKQNGGSPRSLEAVMEVVRKNSRGGSPVPKAQPLSGTTAPAPPPLGSVPPAAANHPKPTHAAAQPPATPPPRRPAVPPLHSATIGGEPAAPAAAAPSAAAYEPYVSSSDPESDDEDDDADAQTQKAMAALAFAAGGAQAACIPQSMVSSSMPGMRREKSMPSMPSLGLSRAGLTGGGSGLLGGIGGGMMGGMGMSGSSGGGGDGGGGGGMPAMGGLGLKLDLTKLSTRRVEGDRPDDDGRQPPTPTALIVERLKAAAAAAAAEKAAEGGGESSTALLTAGSTSSVPTLTHSTSLPDARLGHADLNISRALQELSIQELSVALSHHSSTNRSLLSGSASWAVDASEIRFGRRLGAGAYGEVYEAEWRRSRVAVKRLLTAHPLEEKTVTVSESIKPQME